MTKFCKDARLHDSASPFCNAANIGSFLLSPHAPANFIRKGGQEGWVV